jgi:uncharacterized protein (DUF58 family)
MSLLIAGSILSNTIILLSGTLLLLYLLLEGISFHRAVENAKDSIKLESYPSSIETTVGRRVRIETVIANHSHSTFHIVRLSRNVQPQINEETPNSPRLTLGSNGVQRIETVLKTKLPGYFESATSTILLEGRASLFRQSLRTRDKVTIITQPLVSQSANPIEVSVLTDITTDHLRRGSGTDLAGLRPLNFFDDFHTIDWKATARTGKLMTRDSYLEKDPTVILMIDLSLLENSRREGVTSPAVLDGAGNLIAAFRPASPVGLILHDKRKVVENIGAGQGVISRERILRTLLQTMTPTCAPASLKRRAIRSYADLARETNALMKESTFAAKTEGYWERFSSFASFLLPFYKRAESNYFERLKRQGAHKAFEIVCTLPEPVLVIVVSDGETNLDGIAEGARNARRLNHQVVLAILSAQAPTERIDMLSDLERQDVGIVRCSPEELSRAVNAVILKLSVSRTIASGAGP